MSKNKKDFLSILKNAESKVKSKINPNKKLSLCMIVKNEEKNIARCLNSVKGVVDEIIVVDTGSTDNTVSIAKEMGAEVHYFEWIDDFAAARNYSIEKSTGDWILILDADEELAPESQDKIRSLLIDIDSDICFQVRIKSLDVQDNIMVKNYMIRMFNKSPRIRYKGRVHEFINMNSINLSDEYIYIIHHGYKDSNFVETKQIERNIPILKKILDDPNESEIEKCTTKFYIGYAYLDLGKSEEGINYLKDSIKQSIELKNYSSVQESYLVLIKYYCNKEDFKESNFLFLEAEKNMPEILDNGEFWFFKGFTSCGEKDYQKGIQYFLKSLDTYNDSSKSSFIKLASLDRYFLTLSSICVIAIEIKDIDLFKKYAKISLEEVDKKGYKIDNFKSLIADLYTKVNEFEEAIKIHNKIICEYKNESDLNSSINKLSNIYIKINKFSKSIELQAKIHDPNNVKETWYKLAEILENEGNYIEAEKSYDSIIKILPYESKSYKRRALVKIFQDKKEQSIVDLELSYKYAKTHEEKIDIALTHLQLGNQSIALSYIEKIILEYPNNYDAKLQLSKIEMSNGNYNKSELILNEIIEIDKNRIEAYIQLGNLYLIKKELNKANILFEKSLEIEPYNMNSLYSLSLISIELQNLELANNYLTEALKIEPYNSEILSLYSEVTRN